MEKTIEELKLEADTLGIQYSPNIGAGKLQAKIDEYYEAESKAASIAVPMESTKEDSKSGKETKTANSRIEALRIIKEQEAENSKTEIVKITMVDKREASTATEAYFNNGDLAMRVPLDVFVEMPKALIEMAKTAEALIHMEVNGLTVSKMTKKYVVEYK